MRRLIYIVPAGVFVLLSGFFLAGLFLDPAKIPTVLVDKPVPEFDLPALDARTQGLASGDLAGAVSVINVFASWCLPCRVEHPLLMELAEAGTVNLYGLNYKNRPADAREWLDELGDPFQRIGADLDGRVGIDLGVYGVPETFFIGRDGRIKYKHIGPITVEDMERRIRPLIEKLNQ
jgi:cytochrome c biogenesis protein CcmG/thiol:disulfide interchange protein DsbE